MSVDTKCKDAYTSATSLLQGRLIAPYQRQGVMWMLYRELNPGNHAGGFLCDEMGLGKTVQSIALMLGNPGGKTLVVVPKSVLGQWKEEINRFAPNLKVLVHEGANRSNDVRDFDAFDVVVTSYSLLVERGKPVNTMTILHKIGWHRVMLDEGHEIRNKSSKVSAAAKNLRGVNRWIITGTPVFNSIKDFISLCEFIGIDKSLVQGMTDKIRDMYILRRTKDDVSKFNKRLALPPCVFENVELEMFPDEKKMYEHVYDESRGIVKDIFKNSENVAMHMMHILECFLRCRQAMIHPQMYLDGIAKKKDIDPELWEHPVRKMVYLLDSVKSHPTEKSLIFSQFMGEMEAMHEMFHEEDIRVFRIDGSVSQDDRMRQIAAFRKFEKPCVFIIQIKAGGVGLNLQEATRVYITAPSWNPATELQAIGRSHRTGQSHKVVVKKLFYKGDKECPSIEETIMGIQSHKSTVCAEVLNDPRLLESIPTHGKGAGGVTVRDLGKIFSA